jgi:hypothetical protein
MCAAVAAAAVLYVSTAEAGFLPRFAFPFVKLYGAKAEAAFELVATLLLNWCSGWFDLFPNPPLPLLRRFLVSLGAPCPAAARKLPGAVNFVAA